ncbi:MAG: hypothetical protein WDN49_12830 [Acetobacteraceae bacterium]
MKLARTLQLPTGMAMTFVCAPARTGRPALDLAPREPRSAMVDLFALLDLTADDGEDGPRQPRA